ncbi:MAG: sulfoxide reductase heme-binding subunit YedZ [Magnetospirillum sp. WYHS-4]
MRPWDKRLAFAACLLPLAWLVLQAATGGLGANPIETGTRFLGDWALRFLLLTLAVTPLRHLTGWTGWMRYRRMLGLFCFFYAGLHMTSYVALDQFFDWAAIGRDLAKRRYMTIGMATLALLLPLAATSTDAMVRRLGGPRWKKLHRLVYPAAILAVLHFTLMVKGPPLEPAAYGLVLALLLGWRAWRLRRHSPS